MNKIIVFGPKDKVEIEGVAVNTTSRSGDFGKAFSPFLNQGPLTLGNLRAHNLENLWQFTKVYDSHIGRSDEWKKWRDQGLNDRFAHRYPMGKDKKPQFSWFNGNRLNYIEARKAIYFPGYMQKLNKYCERQINTLIDMLTVTNIWLWDFDGYITNASFDEILNDPNRSMGHAFLVKKFVYDKLQKEW